MVPVAVAGNILGEATPPAGNIFNEAMRGMEPPKADCGPCAGPSRLPMDLNKSGAIRFARETLRPPCSFTFSVSSRTPALPSRR